MRIARNKKELASAIADLRKSQKPIAFVPTMGALHEGHISLVKLGLQHADVVVASVFVNPLQFGPNEDFSKYPRTEKEDLQKLEAAGVALTYLPNVEEMYPKDATTLVHVKGISEELCGAFRPGHFVGVATVVTKLFLQVTPDAAVFGEKDYQQLHIIKQLTRDLDIPVHVIAAPTEREADGLAMSSRNRYLTADERKTAPFLYSILTETAANIKKGQAIAETLSKAKDLLLAKGFRKVDYVELRDATTLAVADTINRPTRLLAAVYLGNARLIDNIEV